MDLSRRTMVCEATLGFYRKQFGLRGVLVALLPVRRARRLAQLMHDYYQVTEELKLWQYNPGDSTLRPGEADRCHIELLSSSVKSKEYKGRFNKIKYFWLPKLSRRWVKE